MDAFPIVVVVSSARDLEPVVELLSALPRRVEQAFIIVQKLDPGRRHMPLDEALAQRVSQPVSVAQDGVLLERGHIYVMRAELQLTIIKGVIRAIAFTSASRQAGDRVLTSLAADRGSRAIGVVLSGGGSDGALGIRAIKESGGVTFAQYPGSARFPGMPINAIETGCVEWILRPYEIAVELARLSRPVSAPRELAISG
jgi:two-component system, chemotaxis family, CheB/CheR fusion protein